MADATIQYDTESATALSEKVKESLSSYIAFKMATLLDVAKVLGSMCHDIDINNGINAALRTWNEVITCDASAIETALSDMLELDANMAQKLLGVEGVAGA
jgi:hypothetical protein